jgi:tRNA uridine 5-carboxymethylaminomethyl modification enzyme
MPAAASQVEIRAKYEGYIERQRVEVARRQENETLALPPELDYAGVKGLSKEAHRS